MKQFFLLVFLLCSAGAFSQKVALKNNLAYDALKTPNLSLEFSMGRKWTFDTQVGMNFFFYTKDATSPRYKTKKFSHWLVQPELRYWTCDVFNGWFFGLHAHGGQMNIGGIDVPFVLQKGDGKMKDHRYEGYFWGGGLSAGYQWYFPAVSISRPLWVSVTCTPVMTSTSAPPAVRRSARGMRTI